MEVEPIWGSTVTQAIHALAAMSVDDALRREVMARIHAIQGHIQGCAQCRATAAATSKLPLSLQPVEEEWCKTCVQMMVDLGQLATDNFRRRQQ